MPLTVRPKGHFLNTKIALYAAALVLLPSCGSTTGKTSTPQTVSTTGEVIRYPAPPGKPSVDALHGLTIQDPFRDLESADSQAVRDWAKEEVDLTARILRTSTHLASTRDALRKERAGERIRRPSQRGDRIIYFKWFEGEARSSLVWRRDGEEKEAVLLRPGTPPLEGNVTLRERIFASPDGSYVAVPLSRYGDDAATIRVVEVESGRLLPETLTDTRLAEPQWLPDSSGFFYVWMPEDVPATDLYRHAEVRFHRIGESAKSDPTVYGPTGAPTAYLSCLLTQDGERLLVGVRQARQSSAFWVRRTKDILTEHLAKHRQVRTSAKEAERLSAKEEWTPLPLSAQALHDPQAGVNTFYFRSNDGASHFQLVRIRFDSKGAPEKAIVVPEQPDRTLVAFRVVGARLGLRWSTGMGISLEMRDLDGRSPVAIAAPATGTFLGPVGRPGQDGAFLEFSSFDRRPEIYRLDTLKDTLSLWWSSTGTVPHDRYKVETIPFETRDGKRSTIFVASRADVTSATSRPLMLSGYGGFSSPIYPMYLPGVLSWIDSGGIYAEAVVRGGGEYGEEWHKEGMLHNKANSFEDFAAAGRELIRLGFTSPDKLVARGESNGGLLVAGTIVRYPELFRAALIRAPLTDMVRYSQFGGGPMWIPEYGDPNDPADLAALLSYSPYHHVKQGQRYPAVLVVTPENDPRVDPMHSRKFVAALQAASTRPALLAFERSSSHMGAEDLDAWVDNEAEVQTFARDAIEGRFETWKTEVAGRTSRKE